MKESVHADEMCWWNHKKRENESIICYICSKAFESKAHLMKHRKKDHSNLVKPCMQFRQNNCRFREEACWFKHVEIESETVEEKDKDEGSKDNKRDDEAQSVFQKDISDLDPPILKQMRNPENLKL